MGNDASKVYTPMNHSNGPSITAWKVGHRGLIPSVQNTERSPNVISRLHHSHLIAKNLNESITPSTTDKHGNRSSKVFAVQEQINRKTYSNKNRSEKPITAMKQKPGCNVLFPAAQKVEKNPKVFAAVHYSNGSDAIFQSSASSVINEGG